MQEEIIRSVLDGRDTLALLPTGGGKSLCFQVPALALKGVCVVISPLIALMKDQVENLLQRGISARNISSAMPYSEVRKILKDAASGEFKFLYVAPERIETLAFIEFLAAADVCLIAVDEAHCISQWGYDFRPAYLRIKKIREQCPGIPVIALTASATPAVQQDICKQLLFDQGNIFRQSFERPNLAYSVEKPSAKENRIRELLNQYSGTAIVYCKSRRQTQRIAELLVMHGISADHYHAGLPHDVRSRKQEAWLKGLTRVMVSTNAFGMGIDKPDVRLAIHAESPDCLENYYQEAGRAGRDGKASSAMLLTNEAELQVLKDQAEIRFPSYAQLKKIYICLMNFFQVPAGLGEGKGFEIDVTKFASNFELEMLQAYYGIQALAKCGVLNFNESFLNPSTVEFNCEREELADIEMIHPALFPTVQGLLRSYEGIFDSVTTIHESKLAAFIGVPYGILVSQLEQLHRTGIIHYKKQSEKPQIYLLLNRMYEDDFRIDLALFSELKKAYSARLSKMIDYVHEETECRSRFISAYFGSEVVTPCNICDNCLSKGNDTPGTVPELAKLILERLSTEQPTTYAEIELLGNKGSIGKALLMLQEEQLIRMNPEGGVFKAK